MLLAFLFFGLILLYDMQKIYCCVWKGEQPIGDSSNKDRFGPNFELCHVLCCLLGEESETRGSFTTTNQSLSWHWYRDTIVAKRVVEVRNQVVSTDEFPMTGRGLRGVITIKFKKTVTKLNKMSCFCIVNEDYEILINTLKGVMIRQKVFLISSQSRAGLLLSSLRPLTEFTRGSVVWAQ